MTQPVVLITGCSSGIGRALCQRLESLTVFDAQGILTLPLDVTDSAAIQTTVDTLLAEEGRIDILVNNAGYGQFGPLMDISSDALQRQFATNVFAPLEMIHRIAPVMKAQGKGMIVNIGSISGLVTTPFAGTYCASKAACHALSDALRLELQPFGIDVVTVQPGAIVSNFGTAGEASLQDWDAAHSWYAPLQNQIKSRARLSQEDGLPAEQFANCLVQKIVRRRPPARLRLGPKSTWLPLLRQWLPTRCFEALISRKFKLNSNALSGSHNR